MSSKITKCFLGSMISTLALPAFADVGAQDVWNDWKEMFEYMSDGQVEASETMSGGELVVSGLVFGISTDDAGYSFSTDEIRFTENGDGTVTVTMAPEMTIGLRVDSDDFVDSDLSVLIRQSGLAMVASGDPGKVTYQYSADSFSSDFSADLGDADDLGRIVYAIAMSGVTGNYTSDATSGYHTFGEMHVDSMEVVSEIGEVQGEVLQATRSLVNDLYSWYDVKVPDGFSFENPQALFEGLVSMKAGYTSASQTMDMQMIQDGVNLIVNGNVGSSSSEIAFDDTGVEVKGDVKDSTYLVQAQGVPFPPVEFSLADAVVDVKFPLYAKPEQQDYRLLLRLIDLDVSDDLWGMIDPTGGIPRVPSTFVLDIDGQMGLLIDLVDPDALDEIEDLPFLLHNMNVNEFQLALAGAKLLANGGFIFDNDNLETFDGLPAPEGRLDVTVSGAITLMDTLVQLGLIPQDQAMGAQMMMSLFMRPDQGEDTWVSEIEVHKDGSVFANGQQLQ